MSWYHFALYMVPAMDKTAQIQASASVPAKQVSPRSGYQRLSRRHKWLIGEHEKLKADFAALEAAFDELKELNAILVSDLRAARQPRGHFPAFLVGQPHGR